MITLLDRLKFEIHDTHRSEPDDRIIDIYTTRPFLVGIPLNHDVFMEWIDGKLGMCLRLICRNNPNSRVEGLKSLLAKLRSRYSLSTLMSSTSVGEYPFPIQE